MTRTLSLLVQTNKQEKRKERTKNAPRSHQASLSHARGPSDPSDPGADEQTRKEERTHQERTKITPSKPFPCQGSKRSKRSGARRVETPHPPRLIPRPRV